MILRDPVHGLIAFESEEAAIIPRLLAASEVQRLRRIRQLGLTSFAFPGAEHTRFAHALGAAHVMILLLARLRQIDGDLPFWQRVTSERARDAIAAAFLHDLGHGPLSHLFEEALPAAARHETWTERILLDPGSEVHRILVADDPHLPRRVADLVKGRHELPYLAKAVSGTFDVDRCDYLLRDAHATGVRYGEYDLPWLLRSLRFDDVSRGTPSAPGLAIDGSKGLAAIEAFLLARLFMFQQVYFHKSTRAAEWMIGAILRRAIAIARDGTRLPQLLPAFASVAAGGSPSLGEYLELDDQMLLCAIHAWEDAKDPILSDLCRRLRARSLFKTIEIYATSADPSPDKSGDDRERGLPASSGQGGNAQSTHHSGSGSATGDSIDSRQDRDHGMSPSPEGNGIGRSGARGPSEAEKAAALATARDIARSAGLDPDVYVGIDVASDVPFSDDESLTVVFQKGRPRRPAEVSFVLGRLRNERLTRVRVIFAPELRDAMREALIR